MLCRMLLTLGRSNMLKLTRPRGLHPADVMFFFPLVFLLFQSIRTNFDANQDFQNDALFLEFKKCGLANLFRLAH
jgi:hypothetical protein